MHSFLHDRFCNTVDAAYETRGYKLQLFIRLKIVWDLMDISINIKIGYKTQIL